MICEEIYICLYYSMYLVLPKCRCGGFRRIFPIDATKLISNLKFPPLKTPESIYCIILLVWDTAPWPAPLPGLIFKDHTTSTAWKGGDKTLIFISAHNPTTKHISNNFVTQPLPKRESIIHKTTNYVNLCKLHLNGF